MLICRTGWLGLDSWQFGFANRSGTIGFCTFGVAKVFKIPSCVQHIRFYLYDSPGKNRVLAKLSEDKFGSGDFVIHCGGQVAMLPIKYAKQKMGKRLKAGNYYVECEYCTE